MTRPELLDFSQSGHIITNESVVVRGGLVPLDHSNVFEPVIAGLTLGSDYFLRTKSERYKAYQHIEFSSEYLTAHEGEVVLVSYKSRGDMVKAGYINDLYSGKVDKEDGKSLIEESERNKLSGIAENAEVNTVDFVSDATKGNFLKRRDNNKLIPISNVELDDLTSDYKASGNTKPYLAFENPSEDQMVDLDVTPITWINELGVYGNFERDSNSDGLADGWGNNGVNEMSLNSDCLYGNFAQKFRADSDNRRIFIYFSNFSDGDVFFVSGNVKKVSGDIIYSDLYSGTIYKRIATSGDSGYVYGNTVSTVSGNPFIYVKCNVVGDVGLADGFQAFNLTKMGAMPSELQTYFGKTNFADLTAAEVEEIAPDYVDSVQTVGYKFGDGSAEEVVTGHGTIVNKGRNLANKEFFSVGRLTPSGDFDDDVPDSYCFVKIPVKPNTTYCISVFRTGQLYYSTFSSSGENITARTLIDNKSGYTTSTITTGDKDYYLNLFENYPDSLVYEKLNFQLEEGTTATEYQPPKSYTETLPELWSMFGVEDTPDSKKFKRVKLVDAVQADGSIDWSWAESAGIEMIDWVNELGTDGSFEVDTNSDGLADGLIKFNSPTMSLDSDSVVDSFSQKTVYNGLSGVYFPNIASKVSVGDKLYFSGYAKLLTGTSGRVKIGKTSSTSEYYATVITTAWEKYSAVFEADGNIYIHNYHTEDGASELIDGFQVINLTDLGELPPKLKAYLNDKYSATWVNFEDISKEAADEIIPDYVHGTATESGRDCLVWNEQEESANHGENSVIRIGSTDDTGWVENDDVMVVFDNTGGEGNSVVETYSARPALSFDGVDDYVSFASPQQFDEFEIMLDLYGIASTQYFIGDGIGANGVRYNGSTLLIGGSTGSYEQFAYTAVNRPVTVKGIQTGTVWELFVDGVSVGVTTVNVGNLSLESIGCAGTQSSFFGKSVYLAKFWMSGSLICDFTLEEGTGNILIDHSGNGNNGTINGATWTTGLVSNPADEIELYQNPEPKLLIEHGKNNIFGDNLFLNFETTYDQYELESIIREEKNKTPILEENEDGVFAMTRNGDKIPLGSTNLPENPETRWKGYSILNLESELPLQKVQGKGYFNSFVNVLGKEGEQEKTMPVGSDGRFFEQTITVTKGDIFYCQIRNLGYQGIYASLTSTMSDPDITVALDSSIVSLISKADYTGNAEVRCYANGHTSDVVVSHKCVINLTEKGELPPSMQAEYGVTRWDMLSETQLDEIIGYENTITGYDGDFADVSLENPGKNLISIDDFPASQAPYAEGTSANGEYWLSGTGLWRDNGVECEYPTKGYHIYSKMIPVKSNTNYILSCMQNAFGGKGHHYMVIRDAEGYDLNTATNYISERYTEGKCEWDFNPGDTNSIFLYIDFYQAHGFLYDFQIEEGSVATPYEPPLPDTQTIPQGFGYAGVYDEIDLKTGTVKKYWKKETGVSTESDGTFSVTDGDYKTSSILIVIDESSGDVETLQELDSSFLSDTVTVIYQTATPTTENLAAYKGIRLVNGTNNILADNMFIDARGTLNQRDIELMMTEGV